MGPIGCSETSVRIYHYSLRNNPEDHSFHHYLLNCVGVLINVWVFWLMCGCFGYCVGFLFCVGVLVIVCFG